MCHYTTFSRFTSMSCKSLLERLSSGAVSYPGFTKHAATAHLQQSLGFNPICWMHGAQHLFLERHNNIKTTALKIGELYAEEVLLLKQNFKFHCKFMFTIMNWSAKYSFQEVQFLKILHAMCIIGFFFH